MGEDRTGRKKWNNKTGKKEGGKLAVEEKKIHDKNQGEKEWNSLAS